MVIDGISERFFSKGYNSFRAGSGRELISEDGLLEENVEQGRAAVGIYIGNG